MTDNRTASDLERLGEQLLGTVVLEDDAYWDQARAAWNLAVDQRPAAVVLPGTPDDVAEVVRAAASLGLRVAAQTTGHNPGPLPNLGDVILIKTKRLQYATVYDTGKRAQAGGGTVWFDVTEPASALGVAPLAGSAPDVGVAGYLLGGGLSWLGRKHGVAANSVISMKVVTADGAVRLANQENEPDLFWALRGGGGSFGVVTDLEFRLYPTPNLYAGWLIWNLDHAFPIIAAWRDWLVSLPDEVTSILRLLRMPQTPVIPETLQGRDLVVVEAAMLLSEQTASEFLAPMRRLRPEIDTFARIPPIALSHLHMDPDQPVPAIGDSRLLSELTTETIDAIVNTVGPNTHSPLVVVELRHLGGELARPHPQGGAISSFDAEFMLFGAGIPTDLDAADAIQARLDVLFHRIALWDSGRRYSSFVEGCADTRLFYPDQAYQRLSEIKARVDPDGIILANHPIPSPFDPTDRR